MSFFETAKSIVAANYKEPLTPEQRQYMQEEIEAEARLQERDYICPNRSDQ